MNPSRADESSPIVAGLAAPTDVDSHDTRATQKSTSWSDSRGMTLGLLFLVTGALGIPLLWTNTKFSHGERIFWSVVVSVYTLALVLLAGGITWWMLKRISEFF